MILQAVLEKTSDVAADARHSDRDHDLVDALRVRKPMAPECLIGTYGERTYRLAASITGNGQDMARVTEFP